MTAISNPTNRHHADHQYLAPAEPIETNSSADTWHPSESWTHDEAVVYQLAA